jgi:foldase protein PrsA
MAYFPVRRPATAFSQKILAFPALLLVGAALLAGCKPAAVSDPNDPKFVVAEKGSWQILRSELNVEVTDFLKQHQTSAEQVGPSKMPMVETMMLKNLVLKKLLLDKAAALPLKDVDKEEATELGTIQQQIPPGQTLDQSLKTAGMTMDDLKKKIHERVLISKVLEAEAFKNVDPTEPQIDDVYMKNKEAFDIPAKVRASRVLIHVDDTATAAAKAAKKKVIDSARARVVKGEDIGKVAADVSEDQSSKLKGGDIGYFAKGENPDAGFDDVAFNTKLGVVSPVFLTPLGYQFIKVTDIQPAGVVPLADARGKISAYLRQHNMQAQSMDYAKGLLANSGVTYHLVLVDPPAQNPAGPEDNGDQSGAPPAPDGSAQAPDSSAPAPAPQAPPTAPQSSAPNK